MARLYSLASHPLFLCFLFCCITGASAARRPLVTSNHNRGFYEIGQSTPIAVRLQIVAAFLLNWGNYQEIAEYCGRTTARTVKRVVKRWLQSGLVEPGRRGRAAGDQGSNVKMTREALSYLTFQVQMHPTFYLAEVRARLWRDLNILVHNGTMSRALARLSWFRKRAQSIATEKYTLVNILRTLRFLAFRRCLNVDACVYVDETGVQDAEVKRRHARAPGKKKAKIRQQYVNRASRVNVVGAMSADGMLPCTLCFHGSMRGELFEWWVVQMLLPCLQPGQTVVMDGAKFHRKNVLRVIFALAGVNLLFTPPHSPEFNPIEEAWGYLKAVLNR